MSTPASGRPWQLDDRSWLAGRYAQDGDTNIALELGCDPRTVRAARRRLGIVSQGVGRRRGRRLMVAPPPPGEPSGSISLTGTLGLLIERFQHESRAGGPAATEETLVARLRGAHDAKQNGDQLAYEDALLGVASAAALVHQHQQRLRKAA